MGQQICDTMFGMEMDIGFQIWIHSLLIYQFIMEFIYYNQTFLFLLFYEFI